MFKSITINATVNAPMDVVWEAWNNPEHVTEWNHASDDWECPRAMNDFRVGGKFVYTMSAIDKSSSFDFSGIYTAITDEKLIAYVMDDGRKVESTFEETDQGVNISVTFDLENENTEALQKDGWQAILNNFKAYAEKQI